MVGSLKRTSVSTQPMVQNVKQRYVHISRYTMFDQSYVHISDQIYIQKNVKGDMQYKEVHMYLSLVVQCLIRDMYISLVKSTLKGM